MDPATCPPQLVPDPAPVQGGLNLAYPVVAHSRNIWCEESLEMGGSPPPIVVVCVNRIGKL